MQFEIESLSSMFWVMLKNPWLRDIKNL